MLIIDNYDSFTYNIVQYMEILGQNPIVIKNDELTINQIKKLKFNKILISPGWGNPDNSGVCLDVINYYKNRLSILGVCLGMQCIAQYFGASIIKAPEPFHGKNSQIFFDKDFKLFKNFQQGFEATRYHSLIIENNNNTQIEIKATTKDKLPMAIQIKNKPIYGVQFHPEAYLTQNGIKIFQNWLELN